MRGRLSEIALAGPEHLDAGYVAAYDRKALCKRVVAVDVSS
jgi:hypothetical protein